MKKKIQNSTGNVMSPESFILSLFSLLNDMLTICIIRLTLRLRSLKEFAEELHFEATMAHTVEGSEARWVMEGSWVRIRFARGVAEH